MCVGGMLLGYLFFFPVFQGGYNGIYIYIGGMLLGYGIIVCCRNFKSTRLNPAKNPCAWEKSCFGVLGISHIGKWRMFYYTPSRG